MNQRFEKLITVARDLNPGFELSEPWKQTVSRLPERDEFLNQALAVLQAEQDQGFFHPRHFKKTVGQKAHLPYARCRLLSELIGQVFPCRIAVGQPTGPMGAVSESVTTRAIQAVQQEGVTLLPQLLADDVVQAIHQELSQLEFQNRTIKQSSRGITGQSALEGTWWLDDTSGFATLELLQRLALDPALLQIAQGVLGVMPIHVQTNAWWTFPNRGLAGESAEKIQKRNAQWFHQDMEFIDFVKVFVYLSDVEADNGPHVYVKGSANDYDEKLPGVAVSSRVADEEIATAFGAERVASITGKAGSVAIVNTRGYHKGAPVLAGHRLLLQLEYACSLYFNPVLAFPRARLTPEHQELRERNPRLFMNYRPAVLAPPRGWRRLASHVSKAFQRRGRTTKKAA